MNIAIIGGGERCKILMEIIEKNTYEVLKPRVVAVADIRENAPGFIKAREMGLWATKDFRNLLLKEGIDLIIELTGKEDIFREVLEKKKTNVRAIDSKTALLFWEINRISDLLAKQKHEFDKTRTMYDAAINAFYQEDVMVLDRDYRILDINDTMLKKLGFPREKVVGRHCYEISHDRNTPCDGKKHPCPLKESLATGKPSQTTHIHKDKNGNDVFFSISYYPIFENDHIVGGVEISKDITKDINFQKGLVQQQKLASIGHLAAGVAHEINNPLTTILTTAMLIQEDLDSEDPNFEELETITNETLRCRKIVTSLLDFARQTKSVKAEHQINEVVKQSVALIRKQAAFQDVVLEPNLAEDIPGVYIDKDQIQQCLINLALNAIAATDTGGKITISTKIDPGGQRVEIAVQDTGKGISKEDLDNIFDPFFTTRESGTGLGLAVTHGLIEQHGGSIEVESKPGQGTTFFIYLPIHRGDYHARKSPPDPGNR